MNKQQVKSVDEYIDSFPDNIKDILIHMRSIIKSILPDVEESLSYHMPTYKFKGKVAYFGAFKKHIGIYALSSVIPAFESELSQYLGAKGTIKFPFDKPIPYKLFENILRLRFEEKK